MLQEFLDYLNGQAYKGIYVWARQGQIATERSIQSSKNTQKNKNYAIAMMKDRQGKGDVIRMFDCSGLGMYWISNIMGWSPDRSSRGMYADCKKKLDRSEVGRGDWVFKHNGLRIVHVGYCMDDNQTIIHDKGSKYGVIREHIDASKWNRYGRPDWFIDEIENEEEIMEVILDGKTIGELNAKSRLVIQGKEAPTPPVFKKAECVHVRACNVRTGRGGDYHQYPKIGAVQPGDIVEVLDDTLNHEYLHIAWHTAENPTGYVYCNDGKYFKWV